jgi:hypothetical protein
MDEIENSKSMPLDREALIKLSLLLGSDYSTGVT